MSTSVGKSVTNPQLARMQTEIAIVACWCWGILENVKITHFEPTYVQRIKLKKIS